MSRASRRWVTVTVWLVVVVSLLAACSGSSSDARGPNASVQSTTPNATSSPSDDSTTRAKAAVLEAYQGYWSAQVEALAHPKRPIPKSLGRYSIDKAQADVQATIVLFRQQGLVLKGQPRMAPEITSVTLGDSPFAAITDCVDSTDWMPIHAKTGKSARPPGQKTRVVMESTAETYDGRWVIRTSVARRDRTC